MFIPDHLVETVASRHRNRTRNAAASFGRFVRCARWRSEDAGQRRRLFVTKIGASGYKYFSFNAPRPRRTLVAGDPSSSTSFKPCVLISIFHSCVCRSDIITLFVSAGLHHGAMPATRPVFLWLACVSECAGFRPTQTHSRPGEETQESRAGLASKEPPVCPDVSEDETRPRGARASLL